MTNLQLQKAVRENAEMPWDTDDYPRCLFNASLTFMKNPVCKMEKWNCDLSLSNEINEKIAKMKPLTFNIEKGFINGQVIITGSFCEFEFTNGNKKVSLKIVSDGLKDVSSISKRFKKIFPETKTEDEKVAVSFWRTGAQGQSTDTSRKLECPTWDEIRMNYEESTRTGLDKLMSPDFKPENGLILWHGEPGMGKTYSLRSLIRHWEDWCTSEVILDPELFFGSGASYMMQVLLGGNERLNYYYDEEEDGKQEWRLLILEDAGELISSDAKMQAGQGFSRMLNLCDGLVGQGFKVMVLITTNEELGAMNDAALRTGRCLSSVEFKHFNLEQANEWRRNNGISERSEGGRVSLSDLYAETRDAKPQHEKRKVGF